MPDPWTEIAVDGEPPSDLSGNVTLYEISDGNGVYFTGRSNDAWMTTLSGPIVPTHWKLWVGSEPPTVDPDIWNFVDDTGNPPSDVLVGIYEIFDGTSTGLTAWVFGQWVLPDPLFVVTHWKPLTLSDLPA